MIIDKKQKLCYQIKSLLRVSNVGQMDNVVMPVLDWHVNKYAHLSRVYEYALMFSSYRNY